MTVLYYSFKPCKSDEFICKALRKFTGEDKDFIIIREKNKKPYVNEKNLCFSLSHTEGLTVCSVSDRETGIDAEKIRKIKNKEKILSRFLKKRAEQNISDTAFLLDWTRFESIVKYNGGTILNPKEFAQDKVNIIGMEMDEYIISVCSEDKSVEREQIV